MGDWLPERTVVVDVPDKAVGREKVSRIHLWIVPAAVQGSWCAPGSRLEIAQRFQAFSATLTTTASPVPLVFDGRIDGATLRGHGAQPIVLRIEGDALRTRRADSAAAPAWPAEAQFRRAGASGCP